MVRLPSPSDHFLDRAPASSVPLFVVRTSEFEAFRSSLPAPSRDFLERTRFTPRSSATAFLPGADGPVAFVLVEDPRVPWDYGFSATRLPAHAYHLPNDPEPAIANALTLGFALGAYRFDRYKKSKNEMAKLVWPKTADKKLVLAQSQSIHFTRDLVNLPANDLGPAELKQAAKQIAKEHGAKFRAVEGQALLDENFPLVHAVGRASSRAPVLVDITWGKPKHPRLTLVGKGVCFDTGGLDLKPAAFMKLMKKDMGGAALVLGLAHLVMSRKLPVRLRVLVPAVENSVSGDAMRPLDVIRSKKGLTVEIGDTDAEGRLVLADALTEADGESPDLIIDAATLTGAARVALGTQMPAVFASKTSTWEALERAGARTEEPLWRLPLHRGYRARLDSSVADISNVGGDSYAGAITAALFLQEFVSSERDWLHVDTMGYNLETRPGRPAGGEALGLLALDEFLLERYGREDEASAASDDEAPERASARAPRASRTSARATAARKKPSGARRARADEAKKKSSKK